jgi:histidinol dehydrogenase
MNTDQNTLLYALPTMIFYIDEIENAGSIFIGNYTPESAEIMHRVPIIPTNQWL